MTNQGDYMKIVLVVFSCFLGACGSSGSSNGNTAKPVIPTPGNTTNTTNYTMQAGRSEPGDVSNSATQFFSASGVVSIPTNAMILADNSENIAAVLTIGNVSCNYQHNPNATSFSYNGCTGGYTPGSSIPLTANSSITWAIASGYCTSNCLTSIIVSVNQ